MSKTDLNQISSDEFRGAIHGQRRSARFTSVSHRADVATQPEPTEPSVEPVEEAKPAPISGNQLVRGMTGRG